MSLLIFSVPKNGDVYNSLYLWQSGQNIDQIYSDILRTQEKLTINPSDIKIYFSSRTTNDKEVHIENPAEVKQTDFSPEKETIFVIHGWINEHRAPMCELVKNAYLSAGDFNVFVVDWGRLAFEEYVHARYQVQPIGKVLAEFILGMVTNNLLSLNMITIVGHSLGAHIAGVTGKGFKGEVKTIVGKNRNSSVIFLCKTSYESWEINYQHSI